MPMAAIPSTRNTKETIAVFESDVGQESVITVTLCCPPTSPIHPALSVGIMQTPHALCGMCCVLFISSSSAVHYAERCH